MRTSVPLLLVAGICGCAATEPHRVGSGVARVDSTRQAQIQTTGGIFALRECAYEIVVAGVPCGPNTACPPSVSVWMKGDDGPGIDHVTLTLRGPGRRHRLDPQANVSEFAGYLFDERHAYRRLLSGEVSIEPTDPRENVRITLDLSFANGVTMRGVSTCPVRGRVDP